jgi:hypothetical protein
MFPRYTFHDPYIVAEVRARYAAADADGRIALLRELYEERDAQPPFEVIAAAACDPFLSVRRWLARNGRSLDHGRSGHSVGSGENRNLIDVLKADSDDLVRASLRENPDIFGFIALTDKVMEWFRESSRMERLALVRNPNLNEDFVALLFDSTDTTLAVTLRERAELCLAVLTNGAFFDRAITDSGLTGSYPWDGWTWYTAERFLKRVWEHAATWPEGDDLSVQYAIYTKVPTEDETKAAVYSRSQARILREAILYSPGGYGEELFAVARHDVDESCREVAYARVAHIDDATAEATLTGEDRPALKGLADNRALPPPQRAAVHKRARARLRELGESTSSFEDFDAMEADAERSLRRPRHQRRRRRGTSVQPAAQSTKEDDSDTSDARYTELTERVEEIDEHLRRFVPFLSPSSVLFYGCAIAVVTALLVKWFR